MYIVLIIDGLVDEYNKSAIKKKKNGCLNISQSIMSILSIFYRALYDIENVAVALSKSYT